MKISYAITVCNEVQELQKLLDFLVPKIGEENEIVVLVDESKAPEEIYSILKQLGVRYERGIFEKDFAAWKNKLNSYCTGDFIFQLDADERPSKSLVRFLPTLLEQNPDVDIYAVPRDNRVEGITAEDTRRWGWRIDDKGRINWPDHQWRIYRNCKEISWKGKVHERPEGFKKYAILPEAFYLNHEKTIQKQRKQNELYSTIQR